MGGHSAWRKRVAKGELAKGAGGAALRHRPRLRRGKDIGLTRKGNIGGGNPKKRNRKQLGQDDVERDRVSRKERWQGSFLNMLALFAVLISIAGSIYFAWEG